MMGTQMEEETGYSGYRGWLCSGESFRLSAPVDQSVEFFRVKTFNTAHHFTDDSQVQGVTQGHKLLSGELQASPSAEGG